LGGLFDSFKGNRQACFLKSNRLIALNEEDKAKGRYTRIDSIQWSENPVQGWVKGREFPVIFHRQVFTNKDDSTGALYLISHAEFLCHKIGGAF
jgi:hypothetical protein